MDPRKIFKKWDDVDETCPTCGVVTKKAKGITHQHLSNLLKPRWNADDFVIMFILIMVIFLALSYRSETAEARFLANDFKENPSKYCEAISNTYCPITVDYDFKKDNPKYNETSNLID